MKKILLLGAMVMALMGSQAAMAQTFDCGMNIGLTTYTNYSPLSLFPDATDSYSNWGYACHIGYRPDNGMIALKLGYSPFSTSAVAQNEMCSLFGFGILLREYASIGEHFEAFYGLGVDATWWGNNFRHLGTDYTRSRWGVNAEVEMGLNYTFPSGLYFGLRAACNFAGLMLNEPSDLPAGLAANEKRPFGGYSLTMQYGFRF